ncbi:FCD domain-containing protein, partial [Streptomyces chryseus]
PPRPPPPPRSPLPRAPPPPLLSLAGNHQLVAIADDLHRRSQWPLLTGDRLGRRADLLADAAEHLALLDALAARDLTVVQSLVGEHFAGADR